MAKDLQTLLEERAQAEAAAMQHAFDAATMAANIDIKTEVGEGFIEVLTPGQEDKLLAQKQLELLREARAHAKDLYLEAHLTFVALLQERRAELISLLFGETAAMDTSTLATAATADEGALKNMAIMSRTSNNRALGQAALLAAYEREEYCSHEIARILDVEALDEDDDDGTLQDLFNELLEIDQEIVDDMDILGEQLRLRFDRLMKDPKLEDLMPGNPQRSILLGTYQ